MSKHTSQQPVEPEHNVAKMSSWQLLWIWMVLGAQSFGGGSATLYLIRRTAVDRYRWITDQEFSNFWGICQIAPGINILGLVSLIGWRVARARGVFLSLAGLLLPSVAITVSLTSIYSGIREAPLVRAALAGIVPATVGLGLLLAFTMMRPLLQSARQDGYAVVTVAVILLVVSTITAARTRIPVLVILWGSGVLAALAQWRFARPQRPPK